ncbi:MAG: ECF transporter S component [Chloroflexota bacterium]|nr:ECF transporter S component [Chloroflexota bacterium]
MISNERGIRRIVIAGLLLAITLLLVFTRIGMIPMPTPAANATIAHIPAIIGGILEGPIVGLLIGMGFGFASFMSATIPMFKDPIVAILPRLMIGVTASWVFILLRAATRRTLSIMIGILCVLMLTFSYQTYQTIAWLGIVVAIVAVGATAWLYWWMRRTDVQIVGLSMAAAVGSLTNTVLVLSAAVWRDYIPFEAAWGIGLTHGIPEAVVSAIVTVAIVSALRHIGEGWSDSQL